MPIHPEYFIENDKIIEHFKIEAISDGLPKIIFWSDESTARMVRSQMWDHRLFWSDHQLDFCNYPDVKTIIYCTAQPDISKFLQIEKVREVFLKIIYPLIPSKS